MSHIIYRGKGYRLENNIEAKQLDYDRFDHLVCYAYNLVGDMPDTVLEILRQVNYKAYAEQDWNLFDLINITKKRYEKACWEFREDFSKAVDRLVAAKCRDYNKSIQPLASAATQGENTPKKERKVILVQKIQ